MMQRGGLHHGSERAVRCMSGSVGNVSSTHRRTRPLLRSAGSVPSSAPAASPTSTPRAFLVASRTGVNTRPGSRLPHPPAVLKRPEWRRAGRPSAGSMPDHLDTLTRNSLAFSSAKHGDAADARDLFFGNSRAVGRGLPTVGAGPLRAGSVSRDINRDAKLRQLSRTRGGGFAGTTSTAAVKVVGKEACVDVKSHGCRRMPEYLLHYLDIGAGRYGQAGRGVPQLVRRQPRQPGLLCGRVEEPRPEVGIA